MKEERVIGRRDGERGKRKKERSRRPTASWRRRLRTPTARGGGAGRAGGGAQGGEQARGGGGFPRPACVSSPSSSTIMAGPGSSRHRSSAALEASRDQEDAGPSEVHPDEESAASTTTKKKGRGKFKGSKIYQLLAGNRNQPISIHFDPRGGKPAGDNGSSLAYEIGLLARTQISLEYKSWTKVPAARREELLDQVREKFTSDASEEVFRSYCFGAFRDRFKEHRSDLNTHFKSFESTDLARQNPPPDISLEDWDLLCTRFDSEAFRKLSKTNQSSRSQLLYNHVGGTRSFVSHRASHATVDEDGVSHDIGGIELFKLTHVNAAGHWTAPEAQNRHSSMVQMMEQQRLASQEAEASGSGLPENLLSEAEICSQVAGRRYTRAIGEGSQSGGRTSRSSSQQFMTMQEEMRLLRERDAERERAMLQLQQRDAEREQREADREQAMRQMQEENDRRFAEIRRMFGGGGSGFGGFGNE